MRRLSARATRRCHAAWPRWSQVHCGDGGRADREGRPRTPGTNPPPEPSPRGVRPPGAPRSRTDRSGSLQLRWRVADRSDTAALVDEKPRGSAVARRGSQLGAALDLGDGDDDRSVGSRRKSRLRTGPSSAARCRSLRTRFCPSRAVARARREAATAGSPYSPATHVPALAGSSRPPGQSCSLVTASTRTSKSPVAAPPDTAAAGDFITSPARPASARRRSWTLPPWAARR